MNRMQRTLLSAVLLTLGLAGQARAGVITIGGSAVASPTHQVDFSTAALGASTAFSGSGLSFTTTGGGGFAIHDAADAGCPQGASSGVSGRYAYFGVVDQASCSLSSPQDSAKIVFDDVVSELSWKGFSRGSSVKIEALLDGSLVSSLVLDIDNRFEDRVVSITGGPFNELRFTEAADTRAFFGIDDMAWNTVGASVPEPGALGLAALGLAGLGWSRRRRSA